MLIHYSVPDDDEGLTTQMELDGDWDITEPVEQKWIAEWCAEDLYDNHDGWEASWPLKIALHEDKNGKEICRFLVELSAEPVFEACEIS